MKFESLLTIEVKSWTLNEDQPYSFDYNNKSRYYIVTCMPQRLVKLDWRRLNNRRDKWDLLSCKKK